MADVREESRLCAIERGEHVRALLFVLHFARARDCPGEMADDEPQKIHIGLVEAQARTDARDEIAARSLIRRDERKDDDLTNGFRPRRCMQRTERLEISIAQYGRLARERPNRIV